MDRVITTVPNGRVDRVVVVRAGALSWLHHPHATTAEHIAQARDLLQPWECAALRQDSVA